MLTFLNLLDLKISISIHDQMILSIFSTHNSILNKHIQLKRLDPKEVILYIRFRL